MLYSKDFIATIKAHPASGLVKACNMAFDKLGDKVGWDEDSYDILSEAYALVFSVMEAGLVDLAGVEQPAFKNRMNENCAALNQFLLRVRKECQTLMQFERIELLKARTRHSLALDPAPDETQYRFEAAEVARLRELIAEMKQLLVCCPELDGKIRIKMTRRLTELESDLRESMTDWDRFWGMLGEARGLLVRAGDNARNFVRGFTEMGHIVGVAQSRVLGIAAPKTPELPLLQPQGAAA